VKDGMETLIWKDVCLDRVPFRIKFLELFNVCEDPYIHVADWRSDQGWSISFRRTLSVHGKQGGLLCWKTCKTLISTIVCMTKMGI